MVFSKKYENCLLSFTITFHGRVGRLIKKLMISIGSGCAILLTSILTLQSISSEPAASTSQTETDNEDVIKIEAPLSKHDNKHLPEQLSESVSNVFHKDFKNMNKDNSQLDLTLHLTKNENTESFSQTTITGSVEIEEKSYNFKGDGKVVTVNYEGNTYYRIRYDAILENTKLESEHNDNTTYTEENTTGFIYVNPDNRNIFKASMTVGRAGNSAALFFGDEHEVASKIEEKAFNMIKEEAREASS
ncbi:hypothetical protein [Salimicrobium flavidum]|uniref:Uncharacterized protein n=1 Tax=Salimicrobium flavidum TaxID=570947 RepID=A0A1N7J827_9BACI|nr:hypothetical protein [Salimicrobium flavidum]SIS45470.1 hypothetical protein SAMN05421687_104112 [Salimicrobium flavidum]